MKISKDEVRYVANLARLHLDEGAIDKFAVQIGNILEYIDTLNQVETQNVAATSHALDLSNAFREDVVQDSIGRESALKNAPEEEDGSFLVPRIIG